MGVGELNDGGVRKSPFNKIFPPPGTGALILTRVRFSEPDMVVEVDVELDVEVVVDELVELEVLTEVDVVEEVDVLVDVEVLEDVELEVLEDVEVDVDVLVEVEEEVELLVEEDVEVVVEVDVVVVGEQGVPAASAIRNGVKSTLAVTLSHPALPGPAAHPHQLFSAAPSVFIEAAVRSSTPNGLLSPAKLLLLIEVPVVANESSSIRMAPCGTTGHSAGIVQGENVTTLAPFRLKQLFCTTTPVAPLRTSSPARAALSKVLPRIISPLALPKSCQPTFASFMKVFPDTVVAVSFLSPNPPNPMS